jgi:shikimate kinase / 3-dehydroquinate synthase
MDSSRNIVLTGFMGTGRTSVGRTVAKKLAREFVDMDGVIEARAGKSIARIFAQDGEAAFRQMETLLCEELGARQRQVIATGGGALVNPANRALLKKNGAVVCLTCDVDEILRRASGNADLPLLAVADRRAEIKRLVQARREAYAAIPWQIDATQLSIEEVAARVIEIASFVTLPVRYPGGQYEIHIGNGMLNHVGGALRAIGAPGDSRVAIVSNPVVAPLYAARVVESLRSAGFLPFMCSIPDGEPFGKTLATVAALYEQFLAGRLDRGDTVLALGGGVTGDIAGFAAATFMRGVRFVQSPTTLLAMVDASVGGKTGVDLPQGKNLVGAFKQPALVMIDPGVLATLPAEEFRSGMAETIKHGVIGDSDLFAELESRQGRYPLTPRKSGGQARESPDSSMADWIARALRVKIAIVEEDPFEQDRRAVLNLGHTVGHALEKLSNFSLRHGQAVSIGMVVAARIAVELGRADVLLARRIETVLSAWGLPVRCPPFDADAILQAMGHDKKRRRSALRWVLPHAIGQVEITIDVSLPIVKSVLCNLGARSEQ